MPCCESERQQTFVECTQALFDRGEHNPPSQKADTDSTPNETSASLCIESTSDLVPSIDCPSIPRTNRSPERRSYIVGFQAPPSETISNARFSICPNNIQDFQYYRTLPRELTSRGDRYSPFWKKSCEEQLKRSWYPTGTDWHDSVSSSSNSSANLMGANSWFTMKWKLHPGKESFRTSSTSCTSTIVECREQESTSRKRKRIQKEKTEEEKEKLKKARMLKAQEKKEERQRALDRMKTELGSRGSLQVPINDPEEKKKIERKEELRRQRESKKKEESTTKKTETKPPALKKRDKVQTVTKSFSVRIKPNKDQKQILNHWIGCARFTYNQGLSIVREYTSKEDKPTINEALFSAIKSQIVPYDKVDRDKPWLHNCPEKIRAYAVHQELHRTYKSNFSKGTKNFEPRFRKKNGLQSIHMPKDKVWYSKESRTFRLFPNDKMKTMYFANLSEEAKHHPEIGAGEFTLFGRKFNSKSNNSGRRSRKKIKMVEKCFQEGSLSKSKFDVTFVRTASNKYELRLTYDEPLSDVQDRNMEKHPEKKFDSVFIDPGNRTFSTMYSPEGFSGSVGDKDISRIFRLLKTHDKLQSEIAKKNNKRNKNSGNKGDPDSLKGGSRIHLDVLLEKIKNLRDEVHWQTISFLVRNFKNIFIPKLDTKNMVMKGSRNLNKKSVRQMLTWSHSIFLERLIGKSREFRDTHVHVVDECYTSKTCGSCGVINESLGSSKWFSCRKCGFQCERDLNGARNIFIKTVCEGVLNIS